MTLFRNDIEKKKTTQGWTCSSVRLTTTNPTHVWNEISPNLLDDLPRFGGVPFVARRTPVTCFGKQHLSL